MKKYDIQILQQDLKAQMVIYDKKEKETQMSSFDHIALSVNGQEINLPFQVIDILQHEIDIVRYSEYVREMWAEDYEGELSDEEAHKISEKMLDYLAQCGDEYEIEELNAKLAEVNLENAKQVWDTLADVPMDPETECIENDWNQFPAGTHREEIWRWIEDTYHVSVAEDLMCDIEEPER